jgi:hypothetical protein
MAKFKCEVIWCAEEKGNRKVTAIFGVDESNIRLWRKHKTAISGCEVSRRKFTGPEKGRFREIDDAVFSFIFKINYCIVLSLRHLQWLYHCSKTQLLTTNLIHMRL